VPAGLSAARLEVGDLMSKFVQEKGEETVHTRLRNILPMAGNVLWIDIEPGIYDPATALLPSPSYTACFHQGYET
jgi:hypothetical protein